jgi:hypothetical protein
MNKIFKTALLAAAIASGVAASAQAVAPPKPSAKQSAASQPAKALFLIKGFRSAQFGMDEAAVRAAVARDFKPAGGAVTAFDNPVEKTHIVAVHLDALAPAPGVVNITYIFGAMTRKLIHVNVVWSTGATPTEQERNQMASGGVELSGYFQTQAWRTGATGAGAATDASYFIFFQGADPKGAAVDLRGTGISIVLNKGDAPSTPAGPATLRLAYYATSGASDTAEVKPGTF